MEIEIRRHFNPVLAAIGGQCVLRFWISGDVRTVRKSCSGNGVSHWIRRDWLVSDPGDCLADCESLPASKYT